MNLSSLQSRFRRVRFPAGVAAVVIGLIIAVWQSSLLDRSSTVRLETLPGANQQEQGLETILNTTCLSTTAGSENPSPYHTVRFPATSWVPLLWYSGDTCSYETGQKKHSPEELETCLSTQRVQYESNPWPTSSVPCAERRKIYDVVIYNDEHILLEIRLNELWDVVDFFVVVESSTAFTGDTKPLAFQKNSHLFRQFDAKIIHVVCDTSTVDVSVVEDPLLRAWPREHASRNCAHMALVGASDHDLVLMADADEIMRPSTMAALVKCSREMDSYMTNSFNHINAGSIRFLSSFRWRDRLFPEQCESKWFRVSSLKAKQDKCRA